jgi:hypothetical protein
MRRDRGLLLGAAVLALALAAPRAASAYCRTTTAGVPADYDPTIDGCVMMGYPLFWKNACVSYDLQKDASRSMSYDDAAAAVAEAFSRWTGTSCPTGTGGESRVSIDVRDFGPVDCGTVEYNQYGSNQHTIVFRDDDWPHNDNANTLALTTVTFDPDTGEIYDADMEINSAQQTLTAWDPTNPYATIPADGFDFLSIVTHETGHFLGMAHSGDMQATMFAHYTMGQTVMRLLTADDVAGICSIYPPGGTRNASPLAVPPDGVVPEDACDGTPRHGWTSECCAKLEYYPDGGSTGQCAPPSTCSVTGGVGRTGEGGLALAWGGVLAVVAMSRRFPRPTRTLPRPTRTLPRPTRKRGGL